VPGHIGNHALASEWRQLTVVVASVLGVERCCHHFVHQRKVTGGIVSASVAGLAGVLPLPRPPMAMGPHP